MPSSADAEREAVATVLIAIERSCLDAEAAFVERRWADVSTCLGRQETLTVELRELFARAPHIAPERDDKVAQRVRGIIAYRDDQLRRMTAYNADIGSRLESIGKMRRFSRAIGSGARPTFFDGQH
ncbi:MAG TPA: hypothetical protein VGN14_07695 [Candidatus Elarobacter sp.]|jgi:hypothetical protein